MNLGFIQTEYLGKTWLDIFKYNVLPHKPTVFKGYTNNWKSRKEWVTEKGEANFSLLAKNYGDESCPVVNIDNGECSDMKLGMYIRLWTTEDSRKFYLKDWHFQKKFGCDGYSLPPFLSTDWANCELWTNHDDNAFRGDYRFMYFGWKDTWTPFHSDVMSSHSWSANVCGRKLWYFVPPGNESYFRKGKEFVKDIREYKHLWAEAGVVELIQEPGEIMFVPSNHYHQVHNIETSISLNHNSVNSTNIYSVYEFLVSRLKDVENELADLKNLFDEDEMQEQIQNVLAADAGLNFPRLRQLLENVIENRSNDDLATCYICPNHENLRVCVDNNECMERFNTNCSCVTETCRHCLSLLRSYDLSIAVQLLRELDSEKI